MVPPCFEHPIYSATFDVLIEILKSILTSKPKLQAPLYHVTLTLIKNDALYYCESTDESSSASLTSFLAPSMSSTLALLASCSPSWIIDLGDYSHMTRTSLSKIAPPALKGIFFGYSRT